MCHDPPMRVLLAALAALIVSVSVRVGSPAHADEYYPRDPAGTLTIQGHGFGHGIGMSMYGAYAAASVGSPWTDILNAYYPGTTRTDLGNPTIRVDVRGDFGNRVAFTPQVGLWVTLGVEHANLTELPTSAGSQGIVTFQVISPSPGSVQLAYLTGDGWWHLWGIAASQINVTSRSLGWFTATTTTSARAVVVGELRAIANAGTIQPVVATPMDQYVRGVTPKESPPSWPAAALAAQAVAARSFGAYALTHPRSSLYDTCDSTSCQVYSGVGWYASTDAAVAATSGVVLSYNGSIALTMFSASNGGYEADGGLPYLPARPDPWDTARTDPYRDWSVTVPASRIQAAWPSIGTFTGVTVNRRDGRGDWGGRVLSLTMTGTSGSVTLTGDQVRGALGLRSTYFTPVRHSSFPTFPIDMSGDGHADVLWTAAGPYGGYLMGSTTDGAGHITGSGAFGWIPWVGAKPFSAGTWDGDAVSDLMMVDPSGTLQMWSGANIGAGSRPVATGLGFGDTFFPFGDFDGDGWSDIGFRRASDGTFWLLHGNGQGGVVGPPTQVSPSMGDLVAAFSPGDMNSDGHPDLVVVGRAGNVAIVYGDGAGHFLAFSGLAGAPDPALVQQWSGYGDVDGDGKSDLVALTSSGSIELFPGTGSGGVGAPRPLGSLTGARSLFP